MKSALLRTGSVPALSPVGAALSSFSNYRPLKGVFSGHKSSVSAPKISLHFQINHRRGKNSSGIRRAASESDITRSLPEFSNPYDQFDEFGSRSQSFPSGIPEEEFFYQDEFDSTAPMEDSGHFDYGFGRGDGGDFAADTFSDGGSKRCSKIGTYYEEMLKLNPNDALLLRNYGKFLHEVTEN